MAEQEIKNDLAEAKAEAKALLTIYESEGRGESIIIHVLQRINIIEQSLREERQRQSQQQIIPCN